MALIKTRAFWIALVSAGVLVVAAFFYFSQPETLKGGPLPDHTVDLANGKVLYTAGGCISCHNPGENASGVDVSLPSGGFAFKTPVGTLYPPNITPDAQTGIGKWSKRDFVNAMTRGLSPSGDHLVPAFPYASYARMTLPDILDIYGYLMSLPAVENRTPPHDMPLAPLVRRAAGIWKRFAMPAHPFAADPNHNSVWNRGAYLVAGAGHCGECHTPRNIFMIPEQSEYLAGSAHEHTHADGDGSGPSLRDLDARGRYKDLQDLKLAFQFGEALGYDDMSSGGMGAVQSNLAKLPDDDVAAIATYLMSLK